MSREMNGAACAVVLFVSIAALGCGSPAQRRAPSPKVADPAPPTPSAPPAAAGSAPPSNGWPFGPPPPADEVAAQLARLDKDPGPIKTNWVPPGRVERYGHAEGLVTAPYERVRARLLDFSHYKDLAGPKFKTVRVVDKQATTTDLYFNLPIMKGLVTIWYVTRFAPPQQAQGGEVLEGTFVKGNIKGMHIAFTVRHGQDDKSTVLTCDLLLSLSIPAPQENVDEELRDACGDAINSVRRTTVTP